MVHSTWNRENLSRIAMLTLSFWSAALGVHEEANSGYGSGHCSDAVGVSPPSCSSVPGWSSRCHPNGWQFPATKRLAASRITMERAVTLQGMSSPATCYRCCTLPARPCQSSVGSASVRRLCNPIAAIETSRSQWEIVSSSHNTIASDCLLLLFECSA